MAPSVRQDCRGRHSNRFGANIPSDRRMHMFGNGVAHFFRTNSNGLEGNSI